jgi:PIN domain nuclease of toxin-antitoxin system
MVIAVTIGVTTVDMKVPHPTPCRKLIRTEFFCWQSLPRRESIYVCVRKVLCRSILAQVVLSAVSFVENSSSWEKELLQVAPPWTDYLQENVSVENVKIII